MGASVGRLYPMPWWKSEKKLLYKLHSSNAEWRAFLIKILNRPRRYLLFTRETLMNVSVLAWSWSPGVIISRVSKKSADCAQWWPQWSVIPRGIYLLLIYSLNELIITLRKKKLEGFSLLRASPVRLLQHLFVLFSISVPRNLSCSSPIKILISLGTNYCNVYEKLCQVSKLNITFVAFGVPFNISVIKRPLCATWIKCEKMSKFN